MTARGSFADRVNALLVDMGAEPLTPTEVDEVEADEWRHQPIPAQTITISSDQLGKEMADRLKQALAGFRVFRSAYYVRLRHDPCMVVLRTTPDVPLLELVQAALSHDCRQAELT